MSLDLTKSSISIDVQVGSLSRTLRGLSYDCGCCVMIASAMNRYLIKRETQRVGGALEVGDWLSYLLSTFFLLLHL